MPLFVAVRELERNRSAQLTPPVAQLFDDKASRDKLPDGASKESVIQKAGEMAMKLYFKNQAKSQGGLMGMASQFI